MLELVSNMPEILAKQLIIVNIKPQSDIWDWAGYIRSSSYIYFCLSYSVHGLQSMAMSKKNPENCIPM